MSNFRPGTLDEWIKEEKCEPTFLDNVWSDISKEIKDDDKSRLFAIIIAGVILLSKKNSNTAKKDRKSKEVTA